MKTITLYTASQQCSISITEEGGEVRQGNSVWTSPTHDAEALEHESDGEPTELAQFHNDGILVAEISGIQWRDLEAFGLVEAFAQDIYEGRDATEALQELIAD